MSNIVAFAAGTTGAILFGYAMLALGFSLGERKAWKDIHAAMWRIDSIGKGGADNEEG